MSKDNKTSGSTASFQQKFGKDTNITAEDETLETSETVQPEPEMLDHASYVNLQTQLTEAEAKSTEYWERMLRMQAEAKNMQQRVERDISNAHKFALEKFVLELLPVIDNLERAIAAHLNDDSGADSLLAGVELTLKMFNSAVEKFGVQQVNPEGQPFNPELHQAVSTQADTKHKAGIVLNVLQKGYLLNNRLIRPAMVVVSK